MPTFTYVRLYADADGISHFEDVEVELAPGRAGTELSEVVPLSGVFFRLNFADYDLDWHTAPRRQFVVNLTGTVEITASDGEARHFGPGSIMLAEDTTGKGHRSRAVSDEPRVSLFLVLAAD